MLMTAMCRRHRRHSTWRGIRVSLCYWRMITQTRYQLIIIQRSVSRYDYTSCKISTATVHNLPYTTSLL